MQTSPQCPESNAAMFGKLARMQLEKAATVTKSVFQTLAPHSCQLADVVNQAANGKVTARGLREEEEINLYYRVIGNDAYVKSLADSESPISVLAQFAKGRKHLLLESLRVFEASQDWEKVYELCEYALNKNEENGDPSFVAFDVRTWKLFIKAATMKSDVVS